MVPGGRGMAFCGAVAALILLGWSSVLQAAPVTFAFKASVDSISSGASFDSEIDLTVGDEITGRFTFDPNAGDGNSPFEVIQPYAFSVVFNGVKLSSAAYETTSRDDVHLDVDCSDLACPGFATSDSLSLKGSNLMEVGNLILSNLDADSSGFQMQLEEWFGHPFWGGMNILDSANIPADIGTWNQFSGRSLKVWLGDGQGGSLSMNATVGQFTVVPEPSSGTLIFLIVISGLANTGRAYRITRFVKGTVR